MKKAPWTTAFPKQLKRTAKELNRAETKWTNRTFKPIPRKPIRRRSAREAKRMAQYNRERVIWLRGRYCEVFPVFKATTIHHMRGRTGPLLMDKRFWKAVSLDGHLWLDSHREEARAKGLLAKRGDWNRMP